MNEIKERNEIADVYRWDLTSLFKDDDDFYAELKESEKYITQLAERKGTLKDAASILSFLSLQTEAFRHIANLFNFASLRRSEDTRKEDAQRMYALSMRRYVEASTACAFAEPEILALDQNVLDALLKDESCADYRVILERIIEKKAHTLSDKEEELLSSFREVLDASAQIADNLMDADMTFESALDSEGKAHEVSSSTYISCQMSLDRELRKNSFKTLYAGYKGHINTFASTYATRVQSFVLEAKSRHYQSSLEMSLSASQIPTSVYDRLIQCVHKHMPAMERYVRLRKRLLGIDELHYYDVYTPLCSGPEKQYDYETAKEMVLKAVKPLGEQYGHIVEKAFAERWVDVYPNKGKSSGAYSSGTYDSNPYILLNFTGHLDSVSTLAHEMGHSLHTWFSNHTQQPQNADYTLFVAEVASTVNENLLIEQLLKEESDPALRLSLLNQYLEGFKGTLYRQTMFAEFERKAHALLEAGETLNNETLCSIYAELVQQYFGEDLVMDEEVRYEWARIPHFYNPFYVYVYATGYSSAVAISEMILNEGPEAVNRYLAFLSCGSSLKPLEELAIAGVDLNDEAPIEKALRKFEAVLDEAEKTADLLGK